MPMDENGKPKLMQAPERHSRLPAATEGAQAIHWCPAALELCVLGQSWGRGDTVPTPDCPGNWGRTAPAGGEMRGTAGRRPGREAGFCNRLCGVYPVKPEGSLLKCRLN